MRKKPLELDMIAGSQLRDTQGEMLSVEGADISELQAGRGRLNDNHGKGFFNSVGRVTFAKKIFKSDDCENERQKYYWEKVKAPFIYVKGVLYDDEEHVNAKAAAAILRNIYKTDCPLKLKASVEGGVVARGIKDPSLLAQTKIHSVALTMTPANQATLVEPLNLDKAATDDAADMLLIKSLVHLAEKDVPSFRHIERVASAEKITRNVYKIKEMLSKGEICLPEDEFVSEHKKLVDVLDKPTKKKLKEEKKEQKKELEELDKGIRQLATGAALAGALTNPISTQPEKMQPMKMDPIKIEAPAPAQPKPQKPSLSPTDIVNWAKSKNPALWAIAQHESSGGKNLKHSTMGKGMHAGQTAGGPWAIMPKTAAYIMSISPKLAEKFPDIAEKTKNLKSNHQAITDALNTNPVAAYNFANTLFNHLKQAHKGDLDKVFHSWYHGLTGTQKIAAKKGKKALLDNDYVKRVKKYHGKTVTQPPKAQKKLKKTLTAGYGGASAPTSATGGSVLMTEHLDDGRHGFKYVTCEHCGNEQIYGKNQVKCRNQECGKSFSMASLYKMMFDSKNK